MAGKKISHRVFSLRHLLSCALFLCLMFACKEDPIGQTPVNGNPPGVVTNVQVEAIPGGAILKFDIPQDEDLLYVKAVYALAENPEAEVKTSFYNNSLTIEGFGDTKERQVALYAVNRSQKLSEPVYVSVTPLTPPIETIYETLDIYEDFGGVIFTWDNETKTNIAIYLIQMIDSIGEYGELETVYTARLTGKQACRGLDAKEAEFGLYIRDYWGNYSDTLFTTLTPKFEMQIPNDRIRAVSPAPASDTPIEHNWYTSYLWDESVTTMGWHTEESSGGKLPHQFTFYYLDGPVQLSRIRVVHRLDDYIYEHGNPRLMELYGKNGDPYDDEGWTFMGEFESIKPSGLPGVGDYTNEDLEYIQNGEDFSVDPNLPAFQYFRMKVLKSWSGGNFAHIMKLPLFGCPEGYEPEY